MLTFVTRFARLVIFVAALLLIIAEFAAAQEVYNLPRQFSSTQGGNNWYYLWGNSANGPNQLAWTNYVNPYGTQPYYFWAGGGRYLMVVGRDPADWRNAGAGGGPWVQTGEGCNVTYAWRAPQTGTIYISAMINATGPNAYGGDPYPDDGIWLSIWKGATKIAGDAYAWHGTTEANRVASATLNASTTIIQAGEYIYFYVNRGAWQDADGSFYSFSISYNSAADLQPPVTTWSFSGHKITLASTDNVSGVANLEYSCYSPTSTSWTSYTAPIALPVGTYKYMIRSIDNNGNLEPYQRIQVTVAADVTPPTTSVALAGTLGPSGWYTSSVTATLTAVDNAGGWGVQRTEYSFDNVNWTVYSAPITISTDGIKTLYYRSVDEAGKVEATKSAVVKIDRTPPTSTSTVGGTAGADGWFTSNATVAIAATDNAGGSGVVRREYSFDGGSWLVYGSPISVSAEGTTTVYYRSVDLVGNVEAAKSTLVKIDKTRPTSSAQITGTAGTDGWYTSDVTVMLAAADAASGVDKIEYSTISDDANLIVYDQPIVISTEGMTTVFFLSTDKAGNVEMPSQNVSVMIDKTAPVTSASAAGTDGLNGWYKSDVTVTLTASDEGSGLKSTEYTTDGTNWQAGISAVVTAEGVTTLQYRSRDQAGNIEETKSIVVKIDKTAPTIILSRTPEPNQYGWNNSDVTASYTATDGSSGLASPQSGTFIFGTEGQGLSHTFVVSDNAGNESSASVENVSIDKTPPALAATGRTPEPNSQGWNNTDVTVGYTASDALSGLASLADGSFVVSTEGSAQSHEFEVSDRAGNKATLTVSNVNIDKTPPVFSGPAAVAFPNDPGQCGRQASNVVLGTTVTDALSGLALSGNDAPTMFSVGATIVTWSALDIAGNSSTKTQSITINDVEFPTVIPPSSITTPVNNGSCGAVVNFAAPIVTDNCSGMSVNINPPSGSVFPVGLTAVKIEATDAAGNTRVSGFSVTVVNTIPVVGAITASSDPAPVNTEITLSVTLTDPDPNDPHTVSWNWGDGTTSDGAMSAANVITGKHRYSAVGLYAIKLTAVDGCGSQAASSYQYLAVYDPDGGFVTAGGWINSPAGAYPKDAALTGKAEFSFNPKYGKGSSVPKGNLEFQLKSSLKFKASSYDWLIVSGAQAKGKGVGTNNGAGNYGFMVSAIDGKIIGDKIDRVRLKIWDKNNGDALVYDNQLGATDVASPTMALGGGSITVHKSGGETTSSLLSLGETEAAGELVVNVIPTEYALYNAYPNPFNPQTTIKYDLPEDSKVRLVVYDLLGREAMVLADEQRPAGQHTVRFDAGSLPSGMYIYRIQAGSFVQTKKLVLVR